MSRGLLLWLCLFPLGAVALEDPMRPPAAPGAGAKGNAAPVEAAYELTSTFVSRERRAAIINGKLVQVGDQVDGVRIEEILPMQVRLQRNGKEWIVRLLPVSVKQPSQAENREQQ